MRVFRTTALAVGALAALLWASAGQADPVAGARGAAAIAAMDLPALVTAVREDKAAVAYYLAELHRRHPDQVEMPDMTEVPPLDPASATALRAASDSQLATSIERVSGEIDALVARGEALRAAAAPAPAAPVSRPRPADTAAPGSGNPYCYKMYGKAYSLCGSDDRSCKMIAASDWGICKKTGRWP